jgi:hypothetical protein
MAHLYLAMPTPLGQWRHQQPPNCVLLQPLKMPEAQALSRVWAR